MLRKPALLLGLIALSTTISLAQDANLQNSITLNVGFANADLGGSRPRIVTSKFSSVNSSVVVNASSVERQAFDVLNNKRIALGLDALAWNDSVAAVARLHSRNMAEQDFFSHKGMSGDLVSDRADRLNLGIWRAIGENIAFNRGFDDPVGKAVDSWLDSPSHRNNILSQTWRESAVGVAIRPDGSYYFTQVFLARK